MAFQDLTPASAAPAHVTVRDLTLAYGGTVIQHDLNFTVRRGDIFVIMGGSGSGKSTLMRHMIGLHTPAKGEIVVDGTSLWAAPEATREALLRRSGVTYQSGGLWSAMTLLENVALPLQEYTDLAPADIIALARLKLAMVGLAGFDDRYPAELSGGMQKRAGLARAIALDPELLYFDEPSAGLDPVTARRLDDLILALRDSLGATVVVVTHELASIFAIASNAIFLDSESHTQLAIGPPRALLAECEIPAVRAFLTRGEG